jgi:Zn-dependent protease
MQTRTLPSWHLAGIEIRLDLSVLVLIGLVTWAFHGVFRADQGPVAALVMAGVGALLVVATTLAHELGHALEARERGIHVDAITLLLFGGVTEMHADGQHARDELAVAAVGPWISLVCAAVFGLVATFADTLVPAAAAPAVGQLAGVLGWWNLLLAAFNLIPGAPLDGGRVLRALLWMLLGDRLRALRISVRAGQLLGLALLGLGVATLVRGGARASLVVAAFALSGMFLIRAAASELRHAELHAALEGRRVAELVAALPTASPTTVDPLPTVQLDDDLHTLIDAFQGDHHQVRVLRDDEPVGILAEADVARLIAELRRSRTGRR